MRRTLSAIEPVVGVVQSTLEQSIIKGRELVEGRSRKLTEGSLLMESAGALQDTAKELSDLQVKHTSRDRSATEAMTGASTQLESAFVTLNDHVAVTTSTAAPMVGYAAVAAAPLIPVAIYYLFEAGRERKETAIMHKKHSDTAEMLMLLNTPW